jgi:phage terminase large subunit GpA-like protein
MGIMLANAERLAMDAMARALDPPPLVDYLAWAEANITITEGSFPGQYNRSLFPYFDEILRALSPDDPCRFVTLMGSAQIGKTTIANVFTGGTMAMCRGLFLYCHPTEDNARRWSKIKLAGLMRSTAVVRDRFPQKSRDGGDSVLFKESRDGLLQLIVSGANSPASLSQITVHFQVQDDLSKWEENPAGDPEAQADNRSRAIEFAKIFKVSTPLVLPGCRISKDFELGSQEYPFVPCPQCQHMQVLDWDNMLSTLDPEHPEKAHFTCISCGFPIEEHHRPQLLAGFEWRAQNPNARRQHRSFWAWSAYSYLQSFELIAREWLKYKGDPAGEKTFANDTIGKPYRAQGEARPWEELRDRARESHYIRGQVPAGALLLMLGLDCQADRVEWQLVGFGRDYRRYVIEYGIVSKHISEPDCQQNLDALFKRTWKNSVGRELGVDFAAIDGNAWTEDVWSFAKRHPASRLIMVRGRGEDTAPRIARVKKERNDKTGKLLKYSRRFYNLGVSVLKMALYRDLGKDDPLLPGYVAFPSGLEDEYFQELTAERREPKKRNGFTVYQWTKPDNQDNEALDTLIQATGAAIKYGVYGLSDVSWARIEAERETPVDRQPDLEDLMAVTATTADGKRIPKPSSGLRRSAADFASRMNKS